MGHLFYIVAAFWRPLTDSFPGTCHRVTVTQIDWVISTKWQPYKMSHKIVQIGHLLHGRLYTFMSSPDVPFRFVFNK